MDHCSGGCRSSQFDGRVYLLDVEFTDEKFVEFEAERQQDILLLCCSELDLLMEESSQIWN